MTMSASWHPVVDPAVVETVVESTPEWLGHLSVFLTQLGSVFVVVPLVVVAYWYSPDRFAHWMPTVIGYYAVMTAIKSLNGATRPEVGPPVAPEAAPGPLVATYEHAATISTTSFPSGNVIAATVLAGLFVLDTRVWTTRRRLLVSGLFVGLVGYTRIGLGVHYPVDVLGGVVIGVGYLGVVQLVRRRMPDPASAVLVLFVVGGVLAAVAVWLRTGIGTPPTVEGLEGSGRTVGLGAAVGGLLAWVAVRDRPAAVDQRATLAAGLAAVAVLVAVALTSGVVAHPLVEATVSAVAFAAVVVTPWVLPNRPLPVTSPHASGNVDTGD